MVPLGWLQVGDVVLRGAMVVPKESKCAFILVPAEVGRTLNVLDAALHRVCCSHTAASSRSYTRLDMPNPAPSLPMSVLHTNLSTIRCSRFSASQPLRRMRCHLHCVVLRTVQSAMCPRVWGFRCGTDMGCVLCVAQGSGLPDLLQSRLNAPRILQVHKVASYAISKLQETNIQVCAGA